MNIPSWNARTLWHRIAFLSLSAAAPAVFLAFGGFRGRDVNLEALAARARSACDTAARLLESNRLADAEQSCRAALNALDELKAHRPVEPGDLRQRATVLDTIGRIQGARDNAGAAESSYQEAIAIWATLVGRDPADVDDREAMADRLDRLGSSFRDAGRWDDAETVYLRACRLCEDVPKAVSNDSRLNQLRADIEEKFARFLLEMGRRFEAVARYDSAVKAQHVAVQSPSTGPDDVVRLVSLLVDRARLLTEIKRPADAEHDLDEAVRRAEGVRTTFPDVGAYQDLAAMVMSDLAEIVQAVPGRESEVVALLERAFALREKSVAEDPAAPESVAKVAGSCVKLADALARQKMRARSEELYRRAILKYARLMDVDSKASAYRLDYGRALRNLADQLRVAGRPDESRRLARESIKQLRDVYASDLRETAHRAAYSLACRTLCAIEIDRKDRRGADQAVREYLEVEPLGFEDALESARLLCRCAQLGREDHALSPAEREDVVRAYTDRAMKALRTAVNDGFRGAEELDASLGYEPLRGREDFRRLICDIKERLEAVRESS